MSFPNVPAAEQAEAFLAWKRGETVEFWNCIEVKWCILLNGECLNRQIILRRKPQPKIRRWKPEEVPVGAWIRGTRWQVSERSLITHVSTAGIRCGCGVVWDFDQAFQDAEHSTDSGKTWQRCGVVES